MGIYHPYPNLPQIPQQPIPRYASCGWVEPWVCCRDACRQKPTLLWSFHAFLCSVVRVLYDSMPHKKTVIIRSKSSSVPRAHSTGLRRGGGGLVGCVVRSLPLAHHYCTYDITILPCWLGTSMKHSAFSTPLSTTYNVKAEQR